MDAAVGFLIKAAIELKDRAEKAKSNKIQCKQLADRISSLVHGIDPKKKSPEEVKFAIDRLRTEITAAKALVEEFRSTNLVQKDVERQSNRG